MTDTTTQPVVSRDHNNNVTVTINIEQLRKKRLMIATPMFGGQCFGNYTKSLYETGIKAAQLGVVVRPYFTFNESLIQRARNYCVDKFLNSDCTHLMFIDADIKWNKDELFMILSMMNDEDDHDIVCGPYPKKDISWEKITKAVKLGVADQDPENLRNYVGDYVFNITGSREIDLRELFEVNEAGTGFMMIKRKVFERIQAKYPNKTYKPDHARTTDFDGSREIYLHFDCIVDPKTKRYLSEDYYFCMRAQQAGNKIWMAPWAKLTHTGTFEFGGSLMHLAQIGGDLTANEVMKSKQ